MHHDYESMASLIIKISIKLNHGREDQYPPQKLHVAFSSFRNKKYQQNENECNARAHEDTNLLFYFLALYNQIAIFF